MEHLLQRYGAISAAEQRHIHRIPATTVYDHRTLAMFDCTQSYLSYRSVEAIRRIKRIFIHVYRCEQDMLNLPYTNVASVRTLRLAQYYHE